MNKSLLLSATLGAAFVAAVVLAAPQGPAASPAAAGPMDRASAYTLAQNS